ncbi:kinase-like protein [Macrolepiota fuliginosa MF-IS2]|uniref:non-specific serine/threonine protein kinase n=1 Tax=Macrolepiota fuliginosa MF-IS2 TaxID=1400762 RepID=A0A9P5XBE6_9AGAR|nr:kinase-like protein [Macrolepiota fuliginosa MF-IS2]
MVTQKERILKDVRFTASDYLCPGGSSDIYRGQWWLSRSFAYIGGKTERQLGVPARLALGADSDNPPDFGVHRDSMCCTMPLFGVFFNPNEKDYPCLVMPYCEDGDLVRYLCGPAAGLEHLHNFGSHPIIHGDIKDGFVRIADFGTSKMLDVPLSAAPGSQMTGSYRWMSPELYLNNNPKTTTASDVWAFGMTILEVCLHRRVPYKHLESYWTVAKEVARGQLPPQPPEINSVMWVLLKWCFSVDPMKRPRAETVSIALNIMLAVERVTPEALDSFMDYMHPLRHEVSASQNFPCFWPGCKAQFDTLIARRPHIVPHWHRWVDGQA